MPMSAHAPLLFSIGHAVELYLKAGYTKLTGDRAGAVRFNHNVAALLKACQKQDPSFLTDYSLRPHILRLPVPRMDAVETLTPADQDHYFTHQELYTVAMLLPELKYLGAGLKRKWDGAFALVWNYPNPYWVEFFRAARAHLGYPQPGQRDTLSIPLERDRLPPRAREHIEQILAPAYRSS
jgi:hypothetical protein